MYLQVGNRARIDNPTANQLAHSLRDLPMDAPFLTLNADEEQFLQATPAGALWRVEWRQESEQRFMIVSHDHAEEAFNAFLRWDENTLAALPWRRLTLWNDPYRRPWVVIILAAVLAGIILVVSAIK